MMTPQEQAWHLKNMTSGAYTTPACPVCSRKLEVRNDSELDPNGHAKDLVYRDQRLEGSKIRCRTLTIKSGADVQFLDAVWAEEMIVNGSAQGNVTVQGRLTVGKGGVLRGLVAARTITMLKGAVLEAETRILNGEEIQPVRAMPGKQVWCCPEWPRCRGQLPLRQAVL